MKRGKPQVVDAVHAADVASVGVAVAVGVLEPTALGGDQFVHVKTAAGGLPSVVSVAVSPACAAAPTDAYWRRTRSIALADQGMTSQSSASQSVESSSHRPVMSTAERTRASAASVSVSWSKNGRPVRVWIIPVWPVSTPNRSRAACLVAADDHDRTRAHVLLLADHLLYALPSVFGEGVLGVLEQVGVAVRSHGGAIVGGR